MAGIQNLPWGGIHHQKKENFSIAILASSYFGVHAKPERAETTLSRFRRSNPSWPTPCSVSTRRMTNALCIGINDFSNPPGVHPIPSGGTHSLSSYELQVSQSAQRGGIGKSLMECLYNIARRWSMKKVMLTVFKGDRHTAWGPYPILSVVPQRTRQHSYFIRQWGLYNFS
jgi:GNAT superfamily N-acetyltransferase